MYVIASYVNVTESLVLTDNHVGFAGEGIHLDTEHMEHCH